MQAIVARLVAIEEMAGMDVLCTDKTGTLTKNQLTLSDPVLIEAVDRDELLIGAALASRSESPDAIDAAGTPAGRADRMGPGGRGLGVCVPLATDQQRGQDLGGEVVRPGCRPACPSSGARARQPAFRTDVILFPQRAARRRARPSGAALRRRGRCRSAISTS